MERITEREELLGACTDTLRELEAQHGPNEAFVVDAKEAIRAVSARADLFGRDDFPLPTDGRRSRLYELSIGDDDRVAIYLHVIAAPMRIRPHDHGTWILHAGVEGVEHHHEYVRTDDRSVGYEATLEEVATYDVGPGDVSALLPDGIHGMEIEAKEPTVSLHVYGLALHRLTDRYQFNLKSGLVEPMPVFVR